jgi:sulfane dehydrogenase subunit SoxC
MSAAHSECPDVQVISIEKALSRLGESISEMEAKEVAARENCECKKGMFALAATRRQLFGGAGLIAAVGMTGMLPRSTEAKAPPGAVEYPVPEDPTKEQGRLMGEDGGYGLRSQFENEVRWFNPTRTASFTPLQTGYGIITPSGLHYERHHAGIPNIDPTKHRLIIHGMVDRPMKYSLADLRRFPTISRTYFMECSGTTGRSFPARQEQAHRIALLRTNCLAVLGENNQCVGQALVDGNAPRHHRRVCAFRQYPGGTRPESGLLEQRR